MRLAYYAGVSTAAAAACLLKAFHQRPNFYSATVYLSQSNACLLILTNLLLVMACSFMYALQRLLYGPLRPIEIEQLSEKAWYAVLDTLLAMPSFREDVGGWLLTMFVLLLAGKVWGWIAEGRVDILEQQPPANPRWFHARLATSLILSVAFDIWMLDYCVESVVADPRPGMMVIFTFEFAILCIFSIFTLARYALSLMEAGIVSKQTKLAVETRKSEIRAERAAARQNETEEGRPAPASAPSEEPIEVDENEVDVPGWEEKRRYLFALEVITDFIKLMIYIVFFTVSITFNGLPMHIMRDVYMTFASFTKRVSDYVAYRKATSDMNSRYPDATTEEIRGDACIVCRETMIAWEQPNAQEEAQPANDQPANTARRRDEGLRAKKLPCGHILHLRCLKAWLERQQVCPTCRRPVVTADQPQAAAGGAAGGGDQPAQGQQGRQPPPRPRARMFNLGPLRVGLLNAPNNQMQNIINQIQNPEGAANQDNAANQQGPNHLGLQVPYANGAAGGQQATAISTRPGSTRATVPIHIQIMQLEQRLMQEAHNLGVEQQQLANLRMMEAEMGRLRTQHSPAQQPVGTTGQRQTQHVQQPLLYPPVQGFMPVMPFQQAFLPPPPPMEQLHGSASQQLNGGDQNLPEGLVLPQGWSLMPLQRTRGNMPVPAPATTMQAQQPSATDSTVPAPSDGPQIPGNENAEDILNPIVAAAPAREQQSAQTTAQIPELNVPTNDRGSPLFVPAQPQAAAHEPPAVSTQPSFDSTSSSNTQPPADLQNTTHDQLASSSESTVTKPTQTDKSMPWAGHSSWNFGDQPAANSGDAAPTQTSSNGHPREMSNGHPPEQQESYSGKGKGKAVEVEEVPDPDAGS